jgi:hypothetical protein
MNDSLTGKVFAISSCGRSATVKVPEEDSHSILEHLKRKLTTMIVFYTVISTGPTV